MTKPQSRKAMARTTFLTLDPKGRTTLPEEVSAALGGRARRPDPAGADGSRHLRAGACGAGTQRSALVPSPGDAGASGAGGKGLTGGSSKKKSSGGGSKPLAKSVSSSTSSGGGSGFPNLGNVVVLGGSGRTHTREVTREVVKEVEVPVAPRSIDCPYCKRSYVPAENEYACPACGAATPPELIEESEKPERREGEDGGDS